MTTTTTTTSDDDNFSEWVYDERRSFYLRKHLLHHPFHLSSFELKKKMKGITDYHKDEIYQLLLQYCTKSAKIMYDKYWKLLVKYNIIGLDFNTKTFMSINIIDEKLCRITIYKNYGSFNYDVGLTDEKQLPDNIRKIITDLFVKFNSNNNNNDDDDDDDDDYFLLDENRETKNNNKTTFWVRKNINFENKKPDRLINDKIERETVRKWFKFKSWWEDNEGLFFSLVAIDFERKIYALMYETICNKNIILIKNQDGKILQSLSFKAHEKKGFGIILRDLLENNIIVLTEKKNYITINNLLCFLLIIDMILIYIESGFPSPMVFTCLLLLVIVKKYYPIFLLCFLIIRFWIYNWLCIITTDDNNNNNLFCESVFVLNAFWLQAGTIYAYHLETVTT